MNPCLAVHFPRYPCTEHSAGGIVAFPDWSCYLSAHDDYRRLRYPRLGPLDTARLPFRSGPAREGFHLPSARSPTTARGQYGHLRVQNVAWKIRVG